MESNAEKSAGSTSMPSSQPEGPEGKADSKRERVESMGWITESTVMPKRGRLIEGVTAGSIVELRAQLYRSQEDAKRGSDSGIPGERTHTSRSKSRDAFSQSNSGVQERAKRDMLQLRAEQDGSAVYAALEKKAALYERIRRGELPDEEEGERYSVDFLRKGTLEEERREMEQERLRHTGEQQGAATPGSEADSLAGVVAPMPPTHKSLVREVNEETVAARERASAMKQQRELQAKRRQEKLRAAFRKKRAEKSQLKPQPSASAH